MPTEAAPQNEDSAPSNTHVMQSARRGQVVAMGGVIARRFFDSSGRWTHPGNAPDARERLWICFGLLLGSDGDISLANAILANTGFQHHVAVRAEEEANHPFDIFVSNHALQLLLLHGDKLVMPVRQKLERWAREVLNDYPGDRQADYQFHGYNDNMPAKACFGMILGGEHFGDDAAARHGLWSLGQLRDMLTRRGMISEFNSPTYTPLTIINLSEISQLAKHPEARLRAAQCVERIWADVLGHFHPPTGMVAGPYSRAYTTDSVGHLSSTNFMLWLTFGHGIWPNPLEEVSREPPRVVLHHAGDLYFVVAQYCWLASIEHSPPPQLVQWMTRRSYPFSLIATAERGEGLAGEWDAGEILATTYQEADFAMGTSEGDWGAQAEELFIQYNLRSAAQGVDDVRTGYVRFLINNDAPGTLASNHNGLFTGEADHLQDMGRYHTVQCGRVTLLTVSPLLKLVGQPLTKMGCAFILPEHLSQVEHIEYSQGHAWIRDGSIYLAVRPLGATDMGRGDSVRIECVNRYRQLWFANYEGPPRAFSEAELIDTVNGFVVVVGSRRDGSFDDFHRFVSDGQLLDYTAFNSRTVRYRLHDCELGISYGKRSGQVRFATINGRPVPRPVWQATGLPPEEVPFLRSPPQPNTLALPYEHLRVIWAPDAKWRIFSRADIDPQSEA